VACDEPPHFASQLNGVRHNHSQQGNADAETYRLFGRSYFADLRLSFQ